MQVFEKDGLKEIFISPIWFVEVRIESAWKSNLVLQYFGNDKTGGFNLYCDIVSLKQQKFKYVSVPFSVWTEIVELLIDSKLENFSKEPSQSDWMVLDGNDYYITIQTPEKEFKIERLAIKPEIEIKEFINEMLDRCSILQTDKIIDYYFCV